MFRLAVTVAMLLCAPVASAQIVFVPVVAAPAVPYVAVRPVGHWYLAYVPGRLFPRFVWVPYVAPAVPQSQSPAQPPGPSQ